MGTSPKLDGEPLPSVWRAFTGVAKGLTQRGTVRPLLPDGLRDA